MSNSSTSGPHSSVTSALSTNSTPTTSQPTKSSTLNQKKISKQTQQDTLAPKKLLLQTIATLVILVLILGVLSYYFKPMMETWSKTFIQHTGVWGVALGFFFPDAFTLPIPPDTFLVAGHLGGLDFWQILTWASAGSILGGCFGFLMIRRITNHEKISQWLKPKIKKGEVFMQAYGLWAVAVAALTPLPYSMICWASGAMGVRFTPFLLVSLLRIPRVAVYLFAIQKTMHFVA